MRGKNSDLEVDQARQRVLEAEVSLSDARASYQAQLDTLKNFLGLPLNLDLAPDPEELKVISARGLAKPAISLQEAIDSALENRLDLRTQEDRTTDTARQAEIALRNFLPKLDVSYNFRSVREDPGEKVALRTSNNTQVFGWNISLPFDWTPRRNSYRRALLSLDQSRRSLQTQRDNVTLEVRNAWRELDRLRNAHRINQESLAVAQRTCGKYGNADGGEPRHHARRVRCASIAALRTKLGYFVVGELHHPAAGILECHRKIKNRR